MRSVQFETYLAQLSIRMGSYDASGVMESLNVRVPKAIKPILAEKRAVCVRPFLKSGLWKDRPDLGGGCQEGRAWQKKREDSSA